MQVYHRLESSDLGVVAEEARRAESLGFDGISSYDLNHDPFLPLLIAAGATNRVSLETRAAIAFPRSPTVAAYISWDLQEYSRGRFKLGLATQSRAQVERRFAASWGSQTLQFREYVQALHAVWDCWETGLAPDFRGEHYTVTLMPPNFRPGPFRYGRPPVYMGAANPNNCRLAGEIADGFMVQTLNSPRFISQVVLPSLEEGARRAGRSRKDIKINSGGTLVTAGNKQELRDMRERARLSVAFYASYSGGYREVFRVHGWEERHRYLRQRGRESPVAEFASEVTDDMLEAFAVVGEYDEIGLMARERYDGLIDEACFSILKPPIGRRNEDDLLRRLIRDLKG